MIYYIIMEFLLILFAAIFCPKKEYTEGRNIPVLNKENNHYYITSEFLFTIFACLLLSFFMGLRSDFAQDYKGYAELFKKSCSQTLKDVLTEKAYTEIGFRIFNKIISFFSHKLWVYMLIFAMLFVSLIIFEGRNQTTNTFIYSILFVNVGIYFLTFNMMRQGFAAAILYAGTKYLRKKSIWQYYLLVLLASTIHYTSLVMLFIYPFMIRDINKKNISKLICLGIFLFIFAKPIIQIIQMFRYAGYTYGMGKAENLNSVIVQWFIFLFSSVVTMMGKCDYKSENGRVVINGAIFFIITSALSLMVRQISRLSYFFSPYLIAYGSNAIEGFTKNNSHNQILKPIIIFLLILYMYIWLYDTSFSQYKFIWSL